MINLFVYGTLMFPEVVKALLGKDFSVKDATLRGYNRYQASGSDGLHPFPVVVIEKGGSVKGKVLFDIDKESMKVLDFFEVFKEPRYQKVKVIVDADGSTVEAFVYIWTEENKKYLSVKWDVGKFTKEDLQDFLKTIPEVLGAYRATF